jgi:hypothetical protein
MAGDWYYAKNGSFEGPETASRLLELLRSGHIESTTLIWRDGAVDWEPLRSALGIAKSAPPPIPQERVTESRQATLRQIATDTSQVPNRESAAVKKDAPKKKGGNWLLWWKIDQAELDRQVSQYGSLGFIHSARGMSVLCLVLSCTITACAAFFGAFGMDSTAYFDVALFAVLALFIYLGHRWAMLGAMALWTLEKVLIIAQGLGPTHQVSGMAFGQILWWALYMHPFYFAFRIEQRRRAYAQTAAA